MNKRIEQLEQENIRLSELLSQRDDTIRTLEKELVLVTPYMRKLADYQSAHINQVDQQ